jgi:hypothetical protein
MRTSAPTQNQPQPPVSAGLARFNPAARGLDQRPHPIHDVWRAMGNHVSSVFGLADVEKL